MTVWERKEGGGGIGDRTEKWGIILGGNTIKAASFIGAC